MRKPNAYVIVQYPADGRAYSVDMDVNYDVSVTSGTDDDIGVHFNCRKTRYAFPYGAVHVTPPVARWLGLALLRAALQHEQEQRLEVRAGRFPHDQVA